MVASGKFRGGQGMTLRDNGGHRREWKGWPPPWSLSARDSETSWLQTLRRPLDNRTWCMRKNWMYYCAKAGGVTRSFVMLFVLPVSGMTHERRPTLLACTRVDPLDVVNVWCWSGSGCGRWITFTFLNTGLYEFVNDILSFSRKQNCSDLIRYNILYDIHRRATMQRTTLAKFVA